VNIKDIYVGSTTNKNRRKQQHKRNCNDENDKEKYNMRVYKFIRETGGFDNWSLILVEKYPCNSKQELEMRERYWMEQLHSTLNSKSVTSYQHLWFEDRCEYYKKYTEENKNHLREHRKEYRKLNEEYLKKQTICECGGHYTTTHLARHLKTNRHLEYISSLQG